MPRLACLLIAFAALTLSSPIGYQVWTLDSSGFHFGHLAAKSSLVPLRREGDLDGNGLSDSLLLENGHLNIWSRSKNLWSSPSSWNVLQALIADLNHDGMLEAVLLVTRQFQPWPVDVWLPNGGRIDGFRDSRGFSSHIILIGWDGESFRELWAGSAMAEPAKQITVARLDGYGDVLVSLEGRYGDTVARPARKVKLWEWNGFGFSLVSSMDGNFRRMEIHENRMAQYLILFR